jgi:hypothetical protein
MCVLYEYTRVSEDSRQANGLSQLLSSDTFQRGGECSLYYCSSGYRTKSKTDCLACIEYLKRCRYASVFVCIQHMRASVLSQPHSSGTLRCFTSKDVVSVCFRLWMNADKHLKPA